MVSESREKHYYTLITRRFLHLVLQQYPASQFVLAQMAIGQGAWSYEPLVRQECLGHESENRTRSSVSRFQLGPFLASYLALSCALCLDF